MSQGWFLPISNLRNYYHIIVQIFRHKLSYRNSNFINASNRPTEKCNLQVVPPLHLLPILPTSHFTYFPFCQLPICLLPILPASHLVKFKFCLFPIMPTSHLVKFKFCLFPIMSTSHLVKFKFCLFPILPTSHLKYFPLYCHFTYWIHFFWLSTSINCEFLFFGAVSTIRLFEIKLYTW